MEKKMFLIAMLLLSTTIFSCQKEALEIAEEESVENIIKADPNNSANRIDLSSQGLVLNFHTTASIGKLNMSTQAIAPTFPYQLILKGKINPQTGANKNVLSATGISAFGNYYAIAYQTPGETYGGGVDIIQIQSGVPQLVSAVNTPDADITCINNGGGRLYLGMDLKTHKKYNYPAPAVVAVIKPADGKITDSQIIALEGHSTKDIAYNEFNSKLYAASSSRGGVSVISFAGLNASRTAHEPYDGARSIAISSREVLVTNGHNNYSTFDCNTGAKSAEKASPVPDGNAGINAVTSLVNGNFLFGNNNYLIHIDKNNDAPLDRIDVGGQINSIAMVSGKIYITTNNSLVVAVIENDKIKIIAKTLFSTAFDGEFNVLSSKIAGDYVFVACGNRGTYVFNLKKS